MLFSTTVSAATVI